MTQSKRMYMVDIDIVTATLTVRGREPGVCVPAEEVIHYLGDGGLLPRTRDRVLDTVPEGDKVKLLLRSGDWTGFEELDVISALRAFEARQAQLQGALS